MKLEIRRKEDIQGKISYGVFIDDRLEESFYAGIDSDPMLTTNEYNAKMLAVDLFNRIKGGFKGKTEVIESEEL